jgi:hypothetical protein
MEGITRRKLTTKEGQILTSIVQGASKEELCQYTTRKGLALHLAKIRSALQPGYKITLVSKRYKLVGPMAGPLPTPSAEAIDPVAFIKDKLVVALEELRTQHEAKSYEHMQLGEDLQALDTKIKDLENSLHVLDYHIVPYVDL